MCDAAACQGSDAQIWPPSQSIAELLAFVQSDKLVETWEGRSD